MNKNNLTGIIILNWNGLNDTVRCLNSLLKIKDSAYKIILIDNGSDNNEGEKLKKLFRKKIDMIALPKNLGFTGGVNKGIEYSKKKYNPEYYLLLNNDTEVDPSFLLFLLDTALRKKDAGIVGSAIYDFYQRNKLVSLGGKVNWLIARPYRLSYASSNIIETDIIMGCSMLISNKVIDKIGMLDKYFFAYFEDSAFCLRAKKAGFRLYCDPRSKVYHKENASSGKGSPFFTYLFSRNRILFVRNNTPILYNVYFHFFNFFKLIFVVFYYYFSEQGNRIAAYLRGYIDGTLNRGGKPSL